MKIDKVERLVTTSDTVNLRDAEFQFVQDPAQLTEFANQLNEAIRNGQSFLIGTLDVSGDMPSQLKGVRGGGKRTVYANTKTPLFELSTNEQGEQVRTDYVNTETGAIFKAGMSFSEVMPAPDAPVSDVASSTDAAATEDDEDEDEA